MRQGRPYDHLKRRTELRGTGNEPLCIVLMPLERGLCRNFVGKGVTHRRQMSVDCITMQQGWVLLEMNNGRKSGGNELGVAHCFLSLHHRMFCLKGRWGVLSVISAAIKESPQSGPANHWPELPSGIAPTESFHTDFGPHARPPAGSKNTIYCQAKGGQRPAPHIIWGARRPGSGRAEHPPHQPPTASAATRRRRSGRWLGRRPRLG